MNTKSNTIPFCVLLIIIFLLPIPLGANRPWAWSFFQIILFALTAMVLINAPRHYADNIKAHKWIVVFWLCFLALSFMQIVPLPEILLKLLSPQSFLIQKASQTETYFLTLDLNQSTVSFVKALSFFCLFYLVIRLVNTEKRIKQLLVVILAAGVFQAIYGIVEILSQANQSLIFNLGVNNVATGSFVYKNHYANFLMMSLAAAIGLLVSAIQKNSLLNSKEVIRSVLLTMLSRKALIRICIAIMVIGLVMSRSRMGNTAFFVSMTVTGVLALILMKRKSKGLSFLVASMFIVDLLIVSAYFGLENVKTRLVETNLSQESRDEVILDALPIVSDFPTFGTGAGSFYSVFPAYQNAEVLDFYDHAHNDYLQFAIEYGLLGFFFLACLYLTAFSLSFKAMRNRRRSIFKGLSFACLMVFIGMGLHMTVDFPLQAYANACYLVIFVALSCIASSLQIRSKSR